jgi:hypothetical protein
MKFINLNALDEFVKISYKDVKLFLLKDFFTDHGINYINAIIKKYINANEKWDPVTLQENLPRKVLNLTNDTPFIELHKDLKGDEFKNKLSKIFDKEIFSVGYKIWWDTEGYQIPLHYDNEKIIISAQIYLGDVRNLNIGTTFSYNDVHINGENNPNGATPFLTIPYIKNTGYVFQNTDKILHGLLNEVPKGFNRFSFYMMIS